MAQTSPSSPRSPVSGTAGGPPFALRLELRSASSRPIEYEVTETGFLLGSVPGCDLRLPGAGLPPVVCLIGVNPQGAYLRRLAPACQIQVNGQAISSAGLQEGDRITLAGAELTVRLSLAQPSANPPLRVVSPAKPEPSPKAAELATREAELAKQKAELDKVREEIEQIRQQLYESYRKRRDELSVKQEAVERAARKVQEQKHAVEAEQQRLRVETAAIESGKAEQLAQAQELQKARQRLEEERQQLREREQAVELLRADLETREQSLTQKHEQLGKDQAQYQSDLVRLDRLQATLEQRQQQWQERARDMDRRADEQQRKERELLDQARELEGLQLQQQQELSKWEQEKRDREAAQAQLTQRSATLDGQQAMLASLRARLERMREDLRRDQQLVAEQQARLHTAEEEVRQQRDETEKARLTIDTDRALVEQERKQFETRRATMEAALVQLRQLQETLSAKEADLEQRASTQQATTVQQAREADRLRELDAQLHELQQRVHGDRQALKERESALLQTEQAREALQEQLRRRGEDLANRQKTLAEQVQQQRDTVLALETRRTEFEQLKQASEQQVAAQRQELEAQARALQKQSDELAGREQKLRQDIERLKEAGRNVGAARKALADERAACEAERLAALDAGHKTRAECDAARRDLLTLQQQVPELELQAQGAADRLAQAREQLREHLAELNNYARQSQEDLESLRLHVQHEAEQVQQQRQTVHRAREEHRLAVAAFRQQLIDWQGRVQDMRRSLAQDETRLDRRQAQVEEQVKHIDAASEELAQQAEQLQVQERLVGEQRKEVARHLDDMREWYRQKLREMSLGRQTPLEVAEGPLRPVSEADLDALTQELDEGDRKLGELLRALLLVDTDTLAALLMEAQRLRRSLRQVLLAGGYLTLYQMALIETGNLDALALGPVRVIDRLRATPREAIYRVYDPRRGQEAVLRHLAESEMEDPIRPDEYRQRFLQASTVRHPHLMTILEVLEIAGRPAVLQESLSGMPSSDWPGLAAAPGVWFRLLCQAALGLHTAHHAGLIHGHLQESHILLTGEGMIKLCGFGEPPWLVVPALADPREGEIATDLLALGKLAENWSLLPSGRRSRPLPETLQAILQRLTSEDPERRYLSAAALLEELDLAGANLPANAEAWDRLVRHIRDHAVLDAPLRQSA